MANKQIIKGVRQNRKLYRPGTDDADALDEVLTPTQVKALKDQNVIAGDFKGKAKISKGDEKPAPNEPSSETVRTGTELPGGFPARMQLIKAGYDTVEKVSAASDDELENLEGVGDATVKKIREEL